MQNILCVRLARTIVIFAAALDTLITKQARALSSSTLFASAFSPPSNNNYNNLHLSGPSTPRHRLYKLFQRRLFSANIKYLSMSSDTQNNSNNNSSNGFINASATKNIPTYDGDDSAKATDFANYFCAYSQLYHQKQMLTDHNRMAAYHAAIMGNSDVFKDKVVMDVGTGSGILAVWAAQAGAKRVYAIEYTDMANHARNVVRANGVDHIVTVIQGAVEEVILPEEDWDGVGLTLENGQQQQEQPSDKKDQRVVDIIISEWMGYFLLRESMLDSLVRARDTFLKPSSGLMMPSHATMLVAPIVDEEERKIQQNEYAAGMEDWKEFAETTSNLYGVDMSG